MLKSGLIIGAVAFLSAAGAAAIVSPLCAVCVGVLLGLPAGYLAGVFDKPMDSGEALKFGAGAGAIAGVGGVIGQLVAAVINALVIGSTFLADFYEQVGLPPTDTSSVWMVQLTLACIVGLLNLALMAGLGAGGGAIWFQTTGQKQLNEY